MTSGGGKGFRKWGSERPSKEIQVQMKENLEWKSGSQSIWGTGEETQGEESHQRVKEYGHDEGDSPVQKSLARCSHSTSAASSATFIPQQRKYVFIFLLTNPLSAVGSHDG